MLISFAILPPPALAAPLASLRARLDPHHAPRTTPHVTLKQPFVLTDSGQQDALVSRVAHVCSRVAGFELTTREVSMFESPVFGAVVHLRVELSDALHALQRLLVSTVAELGVVNHEPEREVRLYYPHLTLAQGLSVEAGRAALVELGQLEESSFRVEQVVIGCCADDGVWTIPHRLPLAAASC